MKILSLIRNFMPRRGGFTSDETKRQPSALIFPLRSNERSLDLRKDSAEVPIKGQTVNELRRGKKEK